jgi:hypothetical protein
VVGVGEQGEVEAVLAGELLQAPTSSGEIPITRAPAARYSSPRSRMPQAWVVQPGVSARG